MHIFFANANCVDLNMSLHNILFLSLAGTYALLQADMCLHSDVGISPKWHPNFFVHSKNLWNGRSQLFNFFYSHQLLLLTTVPI